MPATADPVENFAGESSQSLEALHVHQAYKRIGDQHLEIQKVLLYPANLSTLVGYNLDGDLVNIDRDVGPAKWQTVAQKNSLESVMSPAAGSAD